MAGIKAFIFVAAFFLALAGTAQAQTARTGKIVGLAIIRVVVHEIGHAFMGWGHAGGSATGRCLILENIIIDGGGVFVNGNGRFTMNGGFKY